MVSNRVGSIVDGSRPAVDAATVMVVRDHPQGLQVLLQERHVETDFVGGALVFPGGRVEQADRDLSDTLRSGGDLAHIAAIFGTDARGAIGLLVGAARESFEEAGLLLAGDAEGPVAADVLMAPDVVAARAALAARGPGGDLAGLLHARGLRLDLDALHPFAWWVTPDGMHRRYDTRFFVAVAPEGQRDTATSDQVETVSARWLRPEAALADGEAGRFMIIFPTRKVLGELAQHGTVAELLAALPGRTIPRLQPTLVLVDDIPMVQLPGMEPEFA